MGRKSLDWAGRFSVPISSVSGDFLVLEPVDWKLVDTCVVSGPLDPVALLSGGTL